MFDLQVQLDCSSFFLLFGLSLSSADLLSVLLKWVYYVGVVKDTATWVVCGFV